MARFSFLLPFKFNDGTSVPPPSLMQVRDKLTKRFGGITFDSNPSNPIKGLWLSPTEKRIVSDDLMLLYVWTEQINQAREFFKRYKRVLMKKFKQEQIYIVEETIEVF